MADACKVFQTHAWKKDVCSNCMRSQKLHQSGPVPTKRGQRSSRSATPDGQVQGDTVGQTDEAKLVALTNRRMDEVNGNEEVVEAKSKGRPNSSNGKKASPKAGLSTESKPVIASKPKAVTSKVKHETKQVKDRKEPSQKSDNFQKAGSKDIGAKADGLNEPKSVAGTGEQSLKPKPRRSKVSSRPQGPPPQAPLTDQDEKPKEARVHIKGLTPDKQDKPVDGNNSSDKDNSTTGSHYYHTYDITGSLSRKLPKPKDKQKERVRDDTALIPPYRIVDISKQAVAEPYNSVDVTHGRTASDANPPKLPKSLPPERTARSSSSESGSRDGSWKRSKGKPKSNSGSTGSLANEVIGCKMPFILQEEAARMREESKSPPPVRKVPIMIPSQNSGHASDTYEEIEDLTLPQAPERTSNIYDEADSGAHVDVDSDFSDYSQTNVGCLSFGRNTKTRTSSPKSNIMENKMAALASLDLLKGITGKGSPSSGTSTDGDNGASDTSSAEHMRRIDSEPILDTALTNTADHKQTDTLSKSKKSGKSFFKKLLGFGSRDSTDTDIIPTADQAHLRVDIQAATEAAGISSSIPLSEPIPSTSSTHPLTRKPVLAQNDRQAMFIEFREAMDKKASAPDICRELAVTEVVRPDIGVGGRQEPNTEPGVPSSVIKRKKKNMNIDVQQISPQRENKINNIQQAEEMARSLGIDKVSPRNKTSAPITEGSGSSTVGSSIVSSSTVGSSIVGSSTVGLSTAGTSSAVAVSSESRTRVMDNGVKTVKPVKPAKLNPLNQSEGAVASALKSNPTPDASAMSKPKNAPVKAPRTSTLERRKENDLNKVSRDKDVSSSLDESQGASSSPWPNIPVKVRAKPGDLMSMSTSSIGCVDLPPLSAEGNYKVKESKSNSDSLASPTTMTDVYASVNSHLTSPTSDMPTAKKRRPKSEVRLGKVTRNKMPAPPPPPPMSTSPVPGSGPSASPDHRSSHFATTEPRAAKTSIHPDRRITKTSPDHRAAKTGTPLDQRGAKPGTSPDHRASVSPRRPTGLRPTDISAPILTSPVDVGHRLGSPEGRVQAVKTSDDLACYRRSSPTSRAGRHKTVTEGIDPQLLSPNNPESELDGQLSGKFLNRALPPTPDTTSGAPDRKQETKNRKPAPEKPPMRKPPPPAVPENEYELVSLDGDPDDRHGDPVTAGRAPYEDIDDTIYSDPMELLRDPTKPSGRKPLPDDYLKPVSGSSDEDKPLPLPRIVGNKRCSRSSVMSDLSLYANRDMVLNRQCSVRSVNEGYAEMCVLNVGTLSAKAACITMQLLPQRSEFVSELRWSDFSVTTSAGGLEVDDVVVYPMRNVKVKPHDGFIMVSRRSLSRSLLEWRTPTTVVPVAMFRDKLSTDVLPRTAAQGHYQLTGTAEMNVAVLPYTSMVPLGGGVSSMDAVFTSDLTEYERRAALWVTQVTAAILDLADKWPQLETVKPEHVVVVTTPVCSHSYPIVIVPDMVTCNLATGGASARTKVAPDWSNLANGILEILFRLLRLEPKTVDPVNTIPLRTNYSEGIRRFVKVLTRDEEKLTSHRIITAKVVLETLLWGPDLVSVQPLLASSDPDQSFQVWLEVERCRMVNTIAMGTSHNTLEFANQLSYLSSVTGKMLHETVKILQG